MYLLVWMHVVDSSLMDLFGNIIEDNAEMKSIAWSLMKMDLMLENTEEAEGNLGPYMYFQIYK